VKGDISVTSSPEAGAPAPETAPGVIDPAAIAAELQALRRGYGLLGDVAERIGPFLRELATGTRPAADAEPVPGTRSDAAEVRRKLAAKISELAERLHKDQELAILAALALHEATRDKPTYEKRKEWLAGQLGRDATRTAERRINRAQRQLALEIAGELEARRGRPQVVADVDKWYVESFHADYMLDGALPEAIEHRVIRSNVDGLTELAISLDMPVDSGQPRLPLDLEVISGGVLDLVEAKARTRTRYVIRLPQPLRAGQRHEYETRVRVLPGGPVRDYYVLRPERRCDGFGLRVRFDRARLPAWVRRVEDEDVYSYNTYDDVPADTERVAVDHTGEATASFAGLRTHFGFGLQWGW
jgi:hypothetical protein